MNLDNVQDFIKKNGGLVIIHNNQTLNVLTCFVDDNRKVALVAETDALVAEGTQHEIETKEIVFLPSGSYRLAEPSPYVKIFGKSIEMGSFNTTKVSVPKFETDHTKEINEAIEATYGVIESMCETMVVDFVKRSALHWKKAMTLASCGVTEHGKLPFVSDVYETKKLDIYSRCMDGNPPSPPIMYVDYIKQLETLLSYISAFNMIKNDKEGQKIGIESCLGYFKKNDGSEMQTCGSDQP
jgi:hypothetical protein